MNCVLPQITENLQGSTEKEIKLNPNQGGLFGSSKGWGGVESAHGTFRAICASFHHPNQPNMVSNESWHLYLTLESLNTIPSCIVFP